MKLLWQEQIRRTQSGLYFANRKFGMIIVVVSKRLNICQSAVSRSSYRGEMLANEYDFVLIRIIGDRLIKANGQLLLQDCNLRV